jgi:hypothetical protein
MRTITERSTAAIVRLQRAGQPRVGINEDGNEELAEKEQTT